MSWNGVPLSKLAERRAYSGMVYNVEYVVVLILDSTYLAGSSQGRTSRNVTNAGNRFEVQAIFFTTKLARIFAL